VPADAFVIGINHHPYLIFLRNKKRPFSFAGIYQIVSEPESNEKIYQFSIITITANSLIQDLGYKRMPVILKPEDENRWLRPSASLSNVLYMLKSYPADQMNAYPISARIKDDKLNDVSLIKPTENKLFNEENTPLKYIGKRKIDNSDRISFADRLKEKK
jgi:putative SOS response-associated peptidase YedK